ncbi:uncharacterized protein LOC113779592 [Coffea eugenioides]|uniref:uncharacterized protein LOC113779592 n=1 Tax=Coffea eugenioides TaxID=49369 RepID=UPI000F60D430|nr:uncharacterized protein LOC113779592 [Coffea eugenioides]XP_027181038.1 uncharacterized protein LOC113779592 [Coffea eugenioides]XP_027181045.1 uncharacterized protein LOC113779592 [Coffea eugenioides]
MGFFDLNIPYHESDRHVTKTTTYKSNRLKLVIKAAELGYTGVAYNRVIKGVMSESDRCSTSLFPLSSLLKHAPSFSSSVKFHRDLLNVPVSTPFRQYSRLTVVIDCPAQAAALNSGNPVIKSYDIVAVRPINQNAFEQACQTSEVDIIAIDLSEKLPFRLKQSMVKAAVKRGVYFEISYSSLIVDAQVRRQTISNCKLLVDWTRGKNLIISSAAASVSELRGPYDVANLFSLIGLPFEHAKAAVSKNCRSVIVNALRKKHYYKDAIKVEVMPSSGKVNPEESVFSDWLRWDPISSGEGDLLLDDIEKSFSASGSVHNTVKTVGFASALNSLPSHGLQIKEILSAVESASEALDIGKNLSGADESKLTVSVSGISEELSRTNLLPEEIQTSENDRHQSPRHQDSEMRTLPNGSVNNSPLAEKEINHVVATMELKTVKDLDADLPASDRELHNLHSQSCLDSYEQVPLADHMTNRYSADDADTAHTCHDIANAEILFHSKDVLSTFHGEEAKMPISSTKGLYAESGSVVDKIEMDRENKKIPAFAVSDTHSNEEFRENKQFQEKLENLAAFAIEIPNEESHDPAKKANGSLVSEVEPIEEDMASELMQEDEKEERRKLKGEVAMHCPFLSKSVSGRGRGKRRSVHQKIPFNLKHILNSRPFKRKARKLNTT